MADHPLLGAVLFAMGFVMVAAAYYTSNAQSNLLGHIIALNGVLLVVLGCNKLKLQSANPNRNASRIPAYSKSI
jgi:hypothetical protein